MEHDPDMKPGLLCPLGAGERALEGATAGGAERGRVDAAGDVMTHDPLCACQRPNHTHALNPLGEDCLYCDCDRIAEVRADERERAAQRIRARHLHEKWCPLGLPEWTVGDEACWCYHARCIAAARGEEP